jgi:hypothetical protein
MFIVFSVRNESTVFSLGAFVDAGQFVTLDTAGQAIPAFPGSLVVGVAGDTWNGEGPIRRLSPPRSVIYWQGEFGINRFDHDEQFSFGDTLFLTPDGGVAKYGHKAAEIGTVSRVPFFMDHGVPGKGQLSLPKILGFHYKHGAMMPAAVKKAKSL